MGRYGAHTEAAEAACTSPIMRQLSHSYRSQAAEAAYLASRVHATAGATAERDAAAEVFVAAERAATLAAQRPLGRLADYAAEGVLEAHPRRGAELLKSHVCHARVMHAAGAPRRARRAGRGRSCRLRDVTRTGPWN